MASIVKDVLCQPIELGKQLRKDMKMYNGYAETCHPYIPKILKNSVSFKTLDEEWVGVTLGAEGSEPTNKESLDLIQRFIKKFYPGQYITIPRNALAVSICMPNFFFRNSVHEIEVAEEYRHINGSFTYKKLSSNSQAIYFNQEKGEKFMAALVYYLTPTGKDMISKRAEELIMSNEIYMQEPFPLRDRAFNVRAQRHNQYGRFCSLAGTRVHVFTGQEDGQIVHLEFFPFTRNYVYKGCAECAADFKNYKFVEPKVAATDKAKQASKTEVKSATTPSVAASTEAKKIEKTSTAEKIPTAEKAPTAEKVPAAEKVLADEKAPIIASSIQVEKTEKAPVAETVPKETAQKPVQLESVKVKCEDDDYDKMEDHLNFDVISLH